jgi:hypothetical protein
MFCWVIVLAEQPNAPFAGVRCTGGLLKPPRQTSNADAAQFRCSCNAGYLLAERTHLRLSLVCNVGGTQLQTNVKWHSASNRLVSTGHPDDNRLQRQRSASILPPSHWCH